MMNQKKNASPQPVPRQRREPDPKDLANPRRFSARSVAVVLVLIIIALSMVTLAVIWGLQG